MKFTSKIQFGALALLFVLFSCEDSGKEKPLGAYESGVLILNEGAFGANDGEVFHFDPKTGEVVENVFELENTRPFAGLLEDLVADNERLYLVANTGKVEVVNAGDFKSRGAVVGDLDQPRSLAVVNGKLFISDYGPYDADYNTPDSYVAVVSGLDGGTVKKKIEVPDAPEGLFVSGKYVLVACGSGDFVVIDSETEKVIKTYTTGGNALQFFEYKGKVWVFSRGMNFVTFQSINLSNFLVDQFEMRLLDNATGRMALGKNGQVYLLTSTGWPTYQDAIALVSLENEEIIKEWKTGSGFYGIGYDQERQEIYVANAKGFQGNGEVVIYSEQGAELRKMEVGRGPSGFVFR